MAQATKPPAQKRGMDWPTVAYNALLLAASPLLAAWLGWRMFVRGKSREGLAERLGRLPEQVREVSERGGPVVWFQAVSVGEVAALQPILDEFRAREPMAHPVLSTTTPTGRQMAQRRKLDVEAIFYFPFDIFPAVERTLDALRPAMLVLVESEIWPNLLAAAKRRGVKTCIVNGRIGDKAFSRAAAVRPLFRWALGNIDLICAQSEIDAERFIALGAAPERVKVLGNSKFDEPWPQVSQVEAARMREEFGFPEDAPVLLAGSTHEGEEEAVLEAFSHLRTKYHNLQLIIAPRHPERGDRIHEMVESFGFQVYRRSHAQAGHPQPEPAGPQARVVILDTIGELARVFAVATVVFMGGSLVKVGGHNILQPIAQGKPVLTGPHMHNFRGILDIALRSQAVKVIRDARELEQAVDELLSCPEQIQQMGERGLQMLEAQRGASARMAEALVELLGDGPYVG